jgi:hypothetical protein
VVDPATVGTFSKAFADLAGNVSDRIEYWREFRGKTVQIRTEKITRKPDGVEFTAFVIQGEIDSVVSAPAGFQLQDVEEFVEYYRQTNTRLKSGGRDTHSFETARDDIRTVDEKFVSFSSIDQMEWPDTDAEDLPE